MIKNNIVRLSEFTDSQGVCLLQQKQSGKLFVQDCMLSRLVLNRCEYATFKTTLEISGVSQHPGIFSPLISIWESPYSRFSTIIQTGLGLTPLEYFDGVSSYSKKSTKWNKLTPSGIDIRSEYTYINHLISRNVHDSFNILADNCTINSQYTHTYSGDDGYISASNITIGESITQNAIKTLPYTKKHRDVKQIASDGILSNIKIGSQVYRNGDDDLSASPDGLIIHTDGILENSQFYGLDLISDTYEHGFSSICARNCTIQANLIRSVSGIKIPTIVIKQRTGKPKHKSYGNKITIEDIIPVIVDNDDTEIIEVV